jgi:hypothetical protein
MKYVVIEPPEPITVAQLIEAKGSELDPGMSKASQAMEVVIDYWNSDRCGLSADEIERCKASRVAAAVAYDDGHTAVISVSGDKFYMLAIQNSPEPFVSYPTWAIARVVDPYDFPNRDPEFKAMMIKIAQLVKNIEEGR